MKGRDYIGVGVGAMIFKDGKVLIGKRGSKARDEVGEWDFCGGAVDYGETCEESIIREAEEEFGIKIQIVEFLNFVQVLVPDKNKHWVGVCYIAKVISGEAKPQEKDKFADYKWVYIEEIKRSELTSAGKQNYDAYFEKYGTKAPSSF